MTYNPLAAECTALRKTLGGMEQERSSAQEDLAWHGSFNVEAARRTLAREEAEVAALERDLMEAEERVARTERAVGTQVQRANLGWNPMYWFSAERDEAKGHLERQRDQLNKHQAELRSIKRDLRPHKQRRKAAFAEVARYDAMDPVKLAQVVDQLDADVTSNRRTLEDLERRRDEVDAALESPLRILGTYRADAARFKDDIAAAERLDSDLGAATNSYERALLHEQCEGRFGTRSPRKVVANRRRRLAAVERDIAKTESRLEQLASRASRDVKTVILDGSNLCYEESAFIGLTALQPLVARLATTRDVTVVFDASIRRILRFGDRALRAQLPGATVHVVATRRTADETILDAAADPYTYVISNDRYAEFADKPAVRDDRIIRHEIINGTILVHDLGIRESFIRA
ncbi:hypothetical protein [Luteipulveratus halotolerans]|uniref:RNase NYN domain-containing protein n=1 Tax=Luteipulveratus halotolerans TaxID=1631356 RepID=A0A0L6CGQ8_9MICO|nr:hypothetical protein [Luteipulveratus halotolerans]KNX36981.1 hypothetical protein VV01_07170 [Luteipulveratus halotolerans]